ncbi:GGDEF domain-containing protein [Corallincola platygyrae]
MQSKNYYADFETVRSYIDEGQLGRAERQLAAIEAEIELNEDLELEWSGLLHLTRAHLLFARAPSKEKEIRDVLGLAQSALTLQTASSAYADAWLLQLRVNAKHRDYQSVMVQVNEVINLALHYNDDELAIDALLFAANFTTQFGNSLISVEYLRRAIEIAEPLNSARIDANIDLSYGNFYTSVAMSEKAITLIAGARAFFKENGPQNKLIETLLVLARNYFQQSDWDNAESLYILADDYATHASLPSLKIKAAEGLARLYIVQQAYEAAYRSIETGQRLANSSLEKFTFASLKANWYLANNRLDLAEAAIQEAEIHHKQLPGSTRNSLAGLEIFLSKGELAAKKQNATESFQAMNTYRQLLITRIRSFVAGGIESLLAEMEYERVTNKNQQLTNRNTEYERQLEIAAERQRLQWMVLGLGLALAISLSLYVIRVLVQRKKLKELADTDALTGLLNRRAAVARSENWLKDARLNEVAFVIFDIDFFKKINDNHGHQTGDRILQQFSDLALANTRESDLVARIGGEEFLIVLPGCGTKKAAERAEKLRQVYATHTFINNLRVTASFGVASGHNVSFGKIYEAADRALYKAKETRNQVSLDNDSPYIEALVLED